MLNVTDAPPSQPSFSPLFGYLLSYHHPYASTSDGRATAFTACPSNHCDTRKRPRSLLSSSRSCSQLRTAESCCPAQHESATPDTRIQSYPQSRLYDASPHFPLRSASNNTKNSSRNIPVKKQGWRQLPATQQFLSQLPPLQSACTLRPKFVLSSWVMHSRYFPQLHNHLPACACTYKGRVSVCVCRPLGFQDARRTTLHLPLRHDQCLRSYS
jgi:hypothetical protein